MTGRVEGVVGLPVFCFLSPAVQWGSRQPLLLFLCIPIETQFLGRTRHIPSAWQPRAAVNVGWCGQGTCPSLPEVPCGG